MEKDLGSLYVLKFSSLSIKLGLPFVVDKFNYNTLPMVFFRCTIKLCEISISSFAIRTSSNSPSLMTTSSVDV